jgi:hypothetical protein
MSNISVPSDATILSDIAKINDGAVRNFLKPNGFRLIFQELPAVSYTCQVANIPGVSFGFVMQPTPGGIDIPVIGDKIAFSDLTVQFIIDEDMANYIEIFDWMMALGYQENYQQYTRLAGDRLGRFPFIKKTNSLSLPPSSDAKLIILNSSNIPSLSITYKDVFPIALEPIAYDVTVETIDYLTSSATFKYRSFEIEQL